MSSISSRPHIVSRPSLKINPREPGLVDGWNFGEPVDGVVRGAKGFNGTVYGGAVTELTPLGRGMSFDGADDYVNLYGGRISDATQGSMGFWVKIRTLVDGAAVFGYGGAVIADPGLFELRMYLTGGNYYFTVIQKSDGVPFNFVRGSTPLRINVWYYVELISDGSSWQLYVNNNPETMNVVLGANNGNWFGDTTVAAPRITSVGAALYGGTISDYFTGTIITGTISNVVRPESYQKAEYLRAAPAGFAARPGITVSSADEGGILNDQLRRESSSAPPLFYGDTTGRWQVNSATVQGQRCKVVTCKTAGMLYIPTAYFQQNPTEAAFGTLNFWINKPILTLLRIIVIGSDKSAIGSAAQNGYVFNFNALESFQLYRITGAAFLQLFGTINSYAAASTWHNIKIPRSTACLFSAYLNGQLIIVNVGTNPVLEATHIISNYMIFEMPVGAQIAWSDKSGNIGLWKGVI